MKFFSCFLLLSLFVLSCNKESSLSPECSVSTSEQIKKIEDDLQIQIHEAIEAYKKAAGNSSNKTFIFVSPDNPINPFDFIGKEVSNAYRFASNLQENVIIEPNAALQKYRDDLAQYFVAHPVNDSLSSVSFNILEQTLIKAHIDHNVNQDNDFNIDVIIDKTIENFIVGSGTLLQPFQKKRLLWLISINKHQNFFIHTEGVTMSSTHIAASASANGLGKKFRECWKRKLCEIFCDNNPVDDVLCLYPFWPVCLAGIALFYAWEVIFL